MLLGYRIRFEFLVTHWTDRDSSVVGSLEKVEEETGRLDRPTRSRVGAARASTTVNVGGRAIMAYNKIDRNQIRSLSSRIIISSIIVQFYMAQGRRCSANSTTGGRQCNRAHRSALIIGKRPCRHHEQHCIRRTFDFKYDGWTMHSERMGLINQEEMVGVRLTTIKDLRKE